MHKKEENCQHEVDHDINQYEQCVCICCVVVGR